MECRLGLNLPQHRHNQHNLVHHSYNLPQFHIVILKRRYRSYLDYTFSLNCNSIQYSPVRQGYRTPHFNTMSRKNHCQSLRYCMFGLNFKIHYHKQNCQNYSRKTCTRCLKSHLLTYRYYKYFLPHLCNNLSPHYQGFIWQYYTLHHSFRHLAWRYCTQSCRHHLNLQDLSHMLDFCTDHHNNIHLQPNLTFTLMILILTSSH